MRWTRRLQTLLLACACAAPAAAALAAEPVAEVAAGRDGRHDFDFNIGTWTTDIRRTLDPFAGGRRVVDLHGTVVVRPVWAGAAQLEEIEADGALGHMQGLTMFLYNPTSRQWSQTFVSSRDGSFAGTLVGTFDGGRGELVGADTVDGRAILVRGVWSDITADAHRFEESFSDDGGRTWRTALVARLTRRTS